MNWRLSSSGTKRSDSTRTTSNSVSNPSLSQRYTNTTDVLSGGGKLALTTTYARSLWTAFKASIAQRKLTRRRRRLAKPRAFESAEFFPKSRSTIADGIRTEL